MTARIDVIGGEKGGTGKTACAINLAVMAALTGLRVLLYDADPQGSAAAWWHARVKGIEAIGRVPIHCTVSPSELVTAEERGAAVFSALSKHQPHYDLIVVDCAGADSAELVYALCAAHRLITPIMPSLADLRTVGTIVATVDDVRAKGNVDLKATVVLNKCGSALDRDLYVRRTRAELAAQFPSLAVAKTPIAFRRPVSSAYWEHLAVPELAHHDDRRVRAASKKAVHEFWTLFEELTGRTRPEEKPRAARRKAAAA